MKKLLSVVFNLCVLASTFIERLKLKGQLVSFKGRAILVDFTPSLGSSVCDLEGGVTTKTISKKRKTTSSSFLIYR